MKDINYNELIVTSNGDFNLNDDVTCMQQDQNIIIQSDKGKIINNIMLGVGIFKYLNGPNNTNILNINREIKSECKKQSINVISINIVDNQIYVQSNEK